MYLSKSGYVQVWCCPRSAWLYRYHPELEPKDEDTLARLRTGIEVGELARGLFGPYVNVSVSKEDDSPDIPQMIENTCREMDAGTEIICEAAFSFGGLYCAVDLLRRDGDGWAIYEVKSSSVAQLDKYIEKYIADVSYQKYVLEHCGVKVTGVFLVCIDNSYVLEESGLDLSGLFRVTDLTKQAEAEQENVPGVLETAKQVLGFAEEPSVDLAVACKDCPFFGWCTRDISSPNVFDLYRLRMQQKLDYYRRGLIGFADLEAAGVITNATQKRQMDFALRDRGTYTDAKEIRKFLAGLSYPLYFLDFETMQAAVPFCVGMHPYAQLPFQYSLHYVEHEGGELKHKEFLAESGTDPRRDIALALCRDIPADACVTAFNKTFECTRLKELAEAFPDLAEHLLAIRENMVDLLTPFQKGWYYNRAMGGSFSIKSVLPAIFPDDPELDYHGLEGVHNGSEAMNVFPRIKDMIPEEQVDARKNLLAYCRLDTLAMVRIWDELKRVAGY